MLCTGIPQNVCKGAKTLYLTDRSFADGAMLDNALARPLSIRKETRQVRRLLSNFFDKKVENFGVEVPSLSEAKRDFHCMVACISVYLNTPKIFYMFKK